MKRLLLHDFRLILLLLVLSAAAVDLLMPVADCSRSDFHDATGPQSANTAHACRSLPQEAGDLLGES